MGVAKKTAMFYSGEQLQNLLAIRFSLKLLTERWFINAALISKTLKDELFTFCTTIWFINLL